MSNYKTENEKDLDQMDQIFKMNEVTQLLKLTPRTVRYYESEGLLGEVKRSIGFTRYFTNGDIERLKEVIALKKAGNKIADIKKIFSKKYPITVIENKNKIIINDTLITKADRSTCINNQIEIVDSTLSFENVKLKYSDWETVSFSEFSKPFTLTSDQTPDVGIYFNQIDAEKWAGNAMRSIVLYTLKNHQKIEINSTFLSNAINDAHEWLIIPVKLESSYKFAKTYPKTFLIEYKHQNKYNQYIVTHDDLFPVIERQIKSASLNVNRLIKQVTLHASPLLDNYDSFCDFIKKMVPHQDRLDIENLSPVYIDTAGCTDAVFISMF